MAIIVKTLTKGYRTCFFRNQPVHQFYGHLQAVLREIAPGGEMDSLFARPDNAAEALSSGTVAWSSDLNGEAIKFSDLSPQKQQETAALLSTYMDRIKNYAETRQQGTGKEKDYSNYLKAVAVSPDINQIFLINNKPVLVHWGFFSGDGNHAGQSIYAGWDEFIAEIQRQKKTNEEPAATPVTAAKEAAPIVLPPEPFFANEPTQPQEEKTAKKTVAAVVTEETVEKPLKEAETAVVEAKKQPEKKEEKKAAVENKPKRLVACGLGDYEWVKWLAILLAIIILLLLLLRLLPVPSSRSPQTPPAIMGGGGGGMSDGGGGSGGGGAGGGNGGGGGSGNGGNKAPAPGQPCPTCGHTHNPSQPAIDSTKEAAPGQTRQGSNPSAQPTNREPVVTVDGVLRKGQVAPAQQSEIDNNGSADPLPGEATDTPSETGKTD